MERKALTVLEAAEMIGMSRNGMYEAVRRGEVPAVRIGSRVFIPRAAFERLIEGEGEIAARPARAAGEPRAE